MSNAAESLAREVADLRRRLAALERAPQLSRSTVPGPDGQPVPLAEGVLAGISAGAQAAEAIEAAASALAKADGAVESFFGAEEPEGGKLGDLWRKPTGEILQHDGETWAPVSDPEVRADLDAALGRLSETEGALDGKVSTFFAPLLSPPRAAAVGDLWIVSDAGNLLRRWNGKQWVDARDAGIEEAQEAARGATSAAQEAANAASTAQEIADAATEAALAASGTASNATTAAEEAAALAQKAKDDAASAAGLAGGKADVLIQSATPGTEYRKATTLWIDITSSANTPKRWNGSAWAAVTDKKATDAASAASTAAASASTAATAAAKAKEDAAKAVSDAASAKSTAEAAHTLAGSADQNATAALDSAAGAATAAASAVADASAAKTDAASAVGLAGKKADVLIQATAPAAEYRKATTLWIDTTSSANTPKRWTSGTTWVAVTDKKATDAAAAAVKAQTAADAAKAAADGVSKNLFSTATPSGTAPYGSTWFRVNSSGQVIGQWQQTAAGIASTWTSRPIRSEVIANLDVGKLTAGTTVVTEAVAKKLIADVVEAYTITAPTIQTGSSGTRVVMDKDGLTAFGEGQWVPFNSPVGTKPTNYKTRATLTNRHHVLSSTTTDLWPGVYFMADSAEGEAKYPTAITSDTAAAEGLSIVTKRKTGEEAFGQIRMTPKWMQINQQAELNTSPTANGFRVVSELYQSAYGWNLSNTDSIGRVTGISHGGDGTINIQTPSYGKVVIDGVPMTDTGWIRADLGSSFTHRTDYGWNGVTWRAFNGVFTIMGSTTRATNWITGVNMAVIPAAYMPPFRVMGNNAYADPATGYIQPENPGTANTGLNFSVSWPYTKKIN